MVNYIRAWMILNQKKCWPTSVERGGQMNCSPCSDYRGLAGLGWAGLGWAGLAGLAGLAARHELILHT